MSFFTNMAASDTKTGVRVITRSSSQGIFVDNLEGNCGTSKTSTKFLHFNQNTTEALTSQQQPVERPLVVYIFETVVIRQQS